MNEPKTRPFPDRPRPEFLEFSQEIIKTRPWRSDFWFARFQSPVWLAGM